MTTPTLSSSSVRRRSLPSLTIDTSFPSPSIDAFYMHTLDRSSSSSSSSSFQSVHYKPRRRWKSPIHSSCCPFSPINGRFPMHTLDWFQHKFWWNMEPLPLTLLMSPTAVDAWLERHYPEPRTPSPISRVEQKIDSRAISIDGKRFRDHLFKYGFVRRGGKYSRCSMKEALINPFNQFNPSEYNPSRRSKAAWDNPTGPTPKQVVYSDCHNTWKWIGFRCPCCYLGPSKTEVARRENTQDIRATMKTLRRIYPKGNMAKGPGGGGAGSRGIDWDDYEYDNYDDYNGPGYSYDREFELGFRCEDFDPWEYGEEGEERDMEVERNKSENIWGGREGPWGVLVDRAVDKWERKKRTEVEALGWEVCTQGTVCSTEPEEVDLQHEEGDEYEDGDGDGGEDAEWIDLGSGHIPIPI